MEIDKIKTNVKKMLRQGATEQEVDQYLEYKGVTAEQLRAHGKQPKQEQGLLEGALDTLGNAAHTAGEYSGLNAVGKFAKDAYVGKQDPQYQDLEGFTGNDINDMDTLSQIARGKVSTMTDKGFSGVIKNALGDRLKGVKQDVHGQEIISYQNDKGEIVDRYINKPGLDYEDIDRVAESAVPFVFGGGLAGAMAKGMGLMGRSAAQGTAAAIIDGSLQKQAQSDGSGEDYSFSRSALAGLGGAGGEVLGTFLTRLFSGNGLVDKATGKLTEKGKEWVRANKMDPDAISDDVAKYINQNADKVVEPEELARVARTSGFDIPMTRAQRTKSQSDAYTELEISKGNLKDDAQRVMNNFQKEQTEKINSAAMEQMGDGLAPKAAGKEKVTLGDDIRTGLNDMHSRSKQTENKLWSEIGPMYPKDGAFKSLPDIVHKKALKAGVRPVEGLTPRSIEMQKTMHEFMTGDLTTESFGILTKRSNDNVMTAKGSLSDFLLNTEKKDAIPAVRLFEDYNAHRVANGLPESSIEEISEEILKAGLKPKKMAGRIRYDLTGLKASNNTIGLTDLDGTAQLSIDEVRRMLLNTKKDAVTGSQDARLANHLYEGFNEWIDDAAEKALIQGDDVAAYAKLKTARAFTRDQHKQFAPRDKNGKLTPSAKKIAKIMEGEDSPEGVISSLFGRGNEVSQLANGTVETLAHLRRLLKPSDRSGTFDSIKMAYWVKLVQGKEGRVLSPTRIATNLDKAFANHKTAINVMFNKQEQALMRRFNAAMKDLHVDHPNPSLSSIGVGKLITKLSKGMLNTQATRERFTKQNFLQAHIYNSIAKTLDHLPFVDSSQFVGKRFVKQGLRTRSKNRIESLGGLGAVVNVKRQEE